MPRRLALIAALALAAAAARATTIVPIADAALVDRSPLVAQVAIERSSSPELARTVTDWTVTVERVLKGRIGEGRVVVRVPGGRRADGGERRIFGTPSFAPGRRALLFLSPRKDGTYELADFAQGAFLIAESTRRPLAVRDLSEVRVLTPRGRRQSAEPLRDLRRFSDWIEDRAAGSRRAPDYHARPSRAELDAVTSEFTLLESNGRNFRWFQFDTGGSVSWKLHVNDIPGLAGGGVTELIAGLGAWTGEPSTPVNLVYAGRTTASGGFVRNDGQNVVMAGDPNGEISGSFDCSTGGTLAIGGFDAPGTTGLFNNKKYYRIGEGEIVLQDGIQCKQSGSPNYSKLIEEILGHELGHSLGLGHSSELPGEPNSALRQALMYYRVKDQGLGALLNSDDVAGLQSLYLKTGSGPPPPPGACPLNTLCLLKGRFRVTGTWSNQFDGSSGTAMPIVNTDLSGFFYFTDKANVELIVKILDFGTEIKVFYSQLTNLRFTLTVTDTTTGRKKNYSNTPGDCGAIDQSFAASSSGVSALTDELELATAPATASCVTSTTTLCLLDKRFAVTVDWRNQFDGSSGFGKQKTLSSLTGAFSFGDPANLEILIKTLQFPDKILVIYGSLSNFEYTIRVTDTTTGAVKSYHNAAGQYCGGLDENAF